MIDRSALKIMAGLIDNPQYKYILDDAACAVAVYMTEPVRKNLIKAILLNVQNQKDYSFERLRRLYDLPMGKRVFFEQKDIFVQKVKEAIDTKIAEPANI